MNRQRLVAQYLPEYSFKEYHETMINGSADDVFKATQNLDLSKSRLIKWLFKIRGLPTKRMRLKEFISDIGFTIIEENIPKETLIGFWAVYKIAPIPCPEDFINNSISPRLKVVWNFYIEPVDSGQVRLSTETRILCLTPWAKLFFSLYWMLVRPFSGLIRIKMLQIVKQDLENNPNL